MNNSKLLAFLNAKRIINNIIIISTMLINALDDELVEKIRSLRFDPDAKPLCSQIPLGGMYWPDEFPEETSVIFDGSEKSRDAFLSIFAIRMKYWDEGKFEREDLKVLNEAKSLFPDWPIFRRLKLTKEEWQFQRECEESTLQLIDSFAESADEFKIEENKNRIGSWSATYDLNKDK